MSEFTTFEEYPEVRFMPLGTSGVNIILDNQTYQIRTNVQETIDAVKQYKRAYENACELVDSGSETSLCTTEVDDCPCLEDAYDQLISEISPYKKWNLEGVLEKDSNGQFFLNGRNTPIPNTLADLVVDYQENGFNTEPLCNFWDKVLANPDPNVRDQIMEYIDRYGITITNDGDMVLYKVVTIRQEALSDSKLVGFVASEYMKRKDWGKNPKNYHVYRFDGDHMLANNHTVSGLHVSEQDSSTLQTTAMTSGCEREYLGTLDELFNNLNSLKSEDVRSVYTDKYSGSLDYDLGVVKSMPREECDTNQEKACSKGLHVGAKEYIDWYKSDSPYAEEHIQACLVSPEHVVCIPYDHDMAKIRTCEFLPYAIMEVEVDDNDRTIWKEIEGSFLDVDYTPWNVDDVQERLEDLFVESMSASKEESKIINDQIDVLESRLVEL